MRTMSRSRCPINLVILSCSLVSFRESSLYEIGQRSYRLTSFGYGQYLPR